MAEVKVLGLWASPYVLRARVALNLKKVEYEFLEEKAGEKSELLLKSNPVYKKMPVLLHADRPVCESMVIVEYVDEAWAAGTAAAAIMPADAYDRALHRFWTVYVDDKWFPSLLRISKSRTEEAKEEALAQTEAGLKLLEEAFQKLSKGKGFFGCNSIGYLDIALGCLIGWVKVIEEMEGVQVLNEAKTPLLAGWAAQFSADEAVREVMPEMGKLLEYAKICRARWKAPPPPAAAR